MTSLAVRAGLVAAIGGAALAAWLAAPAGAITFSGGATCTFNPLTATVNVTVDGAGTITRDSLGFIRVNGALCLATVGPAASVTTVDTIIVTGGSGADQLTIDETGGPFAPGKTGEGSGISEIEFSPVNLGAGNDILTYVGGAEANTVRFGTGGVGINADNDADIFPATGGSLNTETFAAQTNAGNDVLSGRGGFGTGNPISAPLQLSGGLGNDSFAGGNGDDAFDGGPDSDLLDYSSASSGVTVNLATGVATGQGNDDVSDVENVDGTPFDDTFFDKDGVRNTFRAFAGTDMFFSGQQKPHGDAFDTDPSSPTFNQSDTFDGGEGSDTVSYELLTDLTDDPIGNLPIDKVFGSPQFDYIPFVENFIGGPGNDIIIDQDGEQNVTAGGPGDDLFISGAQKPHGDAFDTDPSSPTFNQSDTFDGGEGVDTASYENITDLSDDPIGNLPIDKVFGSPQFDYIPNVEGFIGGPGNDIIIDQDGERNPTAGGPGDDIFISGAQKPHGDAYDTDPSSPTFNQSDTFDGGEGSDTVSYEAITDLSDDPLGNLPIDKVFGSPQFDYIPGVENFIGGPGNDEVILQDFNIPGDPSSGVQINIVDGGPGNDIIKQVGTGTQGDEVTGGDGIDFYDASLMDVPNQITFDFPAGLVTATPASDTINTIEASDSGDNASTVIADDNDNIIRGGNGNDVINAAGGNDVVYPSGGNDSVDCGPGTADELSYAGETTPVTVNMSSPTSGTVTGLGTDTFTNCEKVSGSDANDTMTGSTGADLMDGGAGNDVINGGNEKDRLFGGAGDDTIDGQNASDEVHGGAGADTLRGGANGDDLIFGDEGNDNIFGQNGNDTMFGGSNNTSVPSGDDALNGGLGIDRANGEDGFDTCVASEIVSNCEA